MKITKRQLRRIIKEERTKLMSESFMDDDVQNAEEAMKNAILAWAMAFRADLGEDSHGYGHHGAVSLALRDIISDVMKGVHGNANKALGARRR